MVGSAHEYRYACAIAASIRIRDIYGLASHTLCAIHVVSWLLIVDGGKLDVVPRGVLFSLSVPVSLAGGCGAGPARILLDRRIRTRILQ